MTEAARVRVIIVNYNGGALLGRVLEALMGQSHSAFEAVLVDNASADDSIATLLPAVTADPRLTIIRNAENRGFAAANNQAGLSAMTEFVACLNPDAVPEPDWLEQLLRAADANLHCDFFGSTQLSLAQPGIADGLGDHMHATGIAWRAGYNKPVSAPYPSGYVFAPCAAASLYRTKTFQQLNGFCEDYFCYMEDVDLAYRYRLTGGSVWQTGTAVVKHYGSYISGTASDFSTYYGLRNLVWTFMRCTPAPLFALLLPLHFAALDALWIFATKRGQGKLAMQALTDAWTEWPRIRQQRKQIQQTKRISFMQSVKLLAWNPWNVKQHRQRWLQF